MIVSCRFCRLSVPLTVIAVLAIPLTGWTQDLIPATESASAGEVELASRPAADDASSKSAETSAKIHAANAAAIYVKPAKPRDFNQDIYYADKLEFGFDSGYLPNNIPFVFDRMVGIYDRMAPRDYTLVPMILSLRWQFTNIGGRSIFRGNWDFSLSGAYTMIPRSVTTPTNMPRSGAETRYFAHMWGIRRNFVQPNWRAVPYWEGRIGVGNINAKEPLGALWAQGQDLTFTIMMGGGARYNFNSKYSLSAGAAYMHISNLYLSEPRYANYGINTWGPAFGFNVRLGGPKRQTK
jgi:hypothetical protein